MKEYVFETIATPDAARNLAREAMEYITRSITSQDILYDLNLTLTEAVANACEHAYAGTEPGPLTIRLRLEPGLAIELDVADAGKGISLGNKGVHSPVATAESGRGLYIISELMDSFEILRENGETILRFRKSISPQYWA